ncbi:MAG: thiamine phosphate synthase [Roseibium sp.]
MKLDPFYPIVDSADWVARLVPLGIYLIQLRIKDKNDAELRTEIAASKVICDRNQCQLIINDHWQLAIEEKCDFVHLGQEDLVGADVAAIRKAGLKLGVSTHDADELETALSVDPEYIALGPVFPTSSKDVKFAPQGLENVRDWKKKVGIVPLVAIGGISLERSAAVFENGADSIAVISDVTKAANPEARAKDWITATEKWRQD